MSVAWRWFCSIPWLTPGVCPAAQHLRAVGAVQVTEMNAMPESCSTEHSSKGNKSNGHASIITVHFQCRVVTKGGGIASPWKSHWRLHEEDD